MDRTQLKLQHLLWRAGFGPELRSLQQWENLPEPEWWPALKKQSAAPPAYFDVADNAVKGLLMGAGAVGKMERDNLSKEEKQKLRQQSREDIKSLNLLWLDEMVRSKAQLREKMALFWHGHFASLNLNILYQQQLLHVIRTHALGNFGAMLRAVSKSAAMLAFLNNQQNKKQHPNENFAREVMELFTLGRGQYSEADIKEAARAFTGWGFQADGSFVFRSWDHDEGSKTVLGKTGNFNGDDVLDILLKKPETARFIARKLYRFLVNEETVPEARVEALAQVFFEKNLEITPLLDVIFTSDWFYEEANLGAKIKSPVELWVGIRRTLPLQPREPEAQLLLQKALGQVLFYPPNVAGWPGGRQWIDSSSLMLRLRIPQMLLDEKDLGIGARADDDADMGQNFSRRKKRLQAEVDWAPLLARFGRTPEGELLPALARYLWQTPEAAAPRRVLEKHTALAPAAEHLKTTAIQLMATPEYQLC